MTRLFECYRCKEISPLENIIRESQWVVVSWISNFEEMEEVTKEYEYIRKPICKGCMRCLGL